jgi:hypothetical protein
MIRAQLLIGYFGTGLLGAVLLGLIVRRHYRRALFFTLYVVSVFVPAVLMRLWPERFFTPEFWQAKEIVIDVLRFAFALELALRTFRSFPTALRTLRLALLFVLIVTLGIVVSVTPAHLDYVSFVGQIHPRILSGSIWLFTAIAALILWYRVPVHPLYKRVILSYVPFLLFSSVANHALGSLGFVRGWAMNAADQFAYVLLLVYWTFVAWSRAVVPVTPAPLGSALDRIVAEAEPGARDTISSSSSR